MSVISTDICSRIFTLPTGHYYSLQRKSYNTFTCMFRSRVYPTIELLQNWGYFGFSQLILWYKQTLQLNFMVLVKVFCTPWPQINWEKFIFAEFRITTIVPTNLLYPRCFLQLKFSCLSMSVILIHLFSFMLCVW